MTGAQSVTKLENGDDHRFNAVREYRTSHLDRSNINPAYQFEALGSL